MSIPCQQDHTQTAFIDLGLLLMLGMAAVLAIVVQMVSPKVNTVAVPAAGDLIVEAYWPDNLHIDVDLWVRSPNDREAVGYSRRAGQQTNYLRDDTGIINDPSGKNYEFAFTRGRTPGIYVINVHLYNRRDFTDVVPVRVIASLMKDGRMDKRVSVRTVQLEMNGQKEQTAFSFELNEDGNLVKGSVSQEYIPLRNDDGGYEEDL